MLQKTKNQVIGKQREKGLIELLVITTLKQKQRKRQKSFLPILVVVK